MGEKFAANPVTGTGSMSVPIATSPGRSGFGPQLSLSYDSGSGNGPFGFGWSLSLPSISRKTDKGLPQYLDDVDSDIFILSGAEDLVPVYRQNPDGTWVRDPSGRLVVHEDELDAYRVRRYRPRIEGLFARIERWSKIDSPDDVHWRSISKDNILTLYGYDANSRIADPLNQSRIFSWLICESRDDKGNGIRYLYKKEDGTYQPRLGQADPFNLAHQSNRGNTSDPRRTAQRYLQRVLYGNCKPLLDALGQRPRYLSDLPQPPTDTSTDWLFEVRFDYGELNEGDPTGQPEKPWFYRPDAFSSYRSGFEVRTCRRCERVLMLHHIPDQPAVPGQSAQSGYQGIVRSTEFTYDDELDPGLASQPIYSFLKKVVQTGWKQENGSSTRRSLPPVEFQYTQPVVQDVIEEVDSQSLENLPVGLDGSAYRWVDLHGEGIPGILTEQAGAWFYKRNWNPIPTELSDNTEVVGAKFAPLETVALKPNIALSGGAEFMDMAGDGQPDVVVMEGPTPGLYEHDEAEGWQPFRPFTSRLNFDTRDPNVKFIDLDGDGHADVLITESDALVWHASLAEEGFGPARRVAQALDEEKGPRIVFADGTQSIYLADLSGDGLTDIVRIRNGEVCYWPNLGYGRFGAKVTMDNAPWFDNPDQFDQKRIRLADIDGSGTTDIIYLHRDGVRLYFNQSGNSWSKPQQLKIFPRVDDLASIMPIDLLGNGTACLVWSSPWPGDARHPMRYVNLMGKDKPHLLFKTINNLGAETRIDYAPSTKFYLLDKRDGKPWITRLPFPVHVVEKVTTYDYISRNRFVTRYAYHHGYFDGEEREFRGFGMVEQWDTERFAALAGGNVPADNIAAESHVPPVRTRTWFHTGVHLGRERVSRHFENEYFREPGLNTETARPFLLDDTIVPPGLTLEEEREACRALKGSMLRQEVYSDDAEHPGATPEQIQRACMPYTVTEQNFTIRTLQPRGGNRHAVFFTHANETLSYHYERNPADPRIQHALTLEVDDYGNVLKQAAIGYGRRKQIRVVDDQGNVQLVPNPGLSGLNATDQLKQTTQLLTYTENLVTKDHDTGKNAVDRNDDYRTPLPCETLTFELTGYTASGPVIGPATIPAERIQRYQASDFVEPDPASLGRLRHKFKDQVYYEVPATSNSCRRPIEWLRTLYRPDDCGKLDNNPLRLLPLCSLQPLALPGESYKLAFTPGLLAQIFQRPRAGQPAEPLLPDPAVVLGGKGGKQGGYLRTQTMKADGRFPATDVDDYWWIPSGRSFYHPNDVAAAVELAEAWAHFFLPRRYRDPFGQDAFVDFDAHDLLMTATRDALGNRVTVDVNDYRALQPRLVSDPNRNWAEVAFDTLGMVVGTAVMGKPEEGLGDNLAGFVADLTQTEIDEFFANPQEPDTNDPFRRSRATAIVHQLLGNASTRIVYDLDRFRRTRKDYPTEPDKWEPSFAATIARETHISDLKLNRKSKLQISFSYSDGFGREIQKKIQAEPGPFEISDPLSAIANPRWVGSGWTIFNNKGKPIRQYEPFFSKRQRPDGTLFSDHRFEFGVMVGVSPVLFYDPAERIVATLHPNHTYEKVVFDPWQQTTCDVNDTVALFDLASRTAKVLDPAADPDVGGFFQRLPDDDYLPTWYDLRTDSAKALAEWPDTDSQGNALPENAQRRKTEKDAAAKAASHADTPTTAHFDSLGRPFLTAARNRVECKDHPLHRRPDEEFLTRIELDIEGNQRAVYDERKLPVNYLPVGDVEQRIVMIYDYDLLGNRIHQLSMEAGTRWMLNDVAGKPIRAWDSRGHNFTTTYDALRRPIEQYVRGTFSDPDPLKPNSDPRTLNIDILIDKVEYGEPLAGASQAELDRAVRFNLRTRIYRHSDSAGVATNARLDANGNPTEAYDFKGNLLCSTRRLVSDYKTIPDWQLPPQLDAETFQGSTRYDALNRPIQSVAPHSSLTRAGHPDKFNVIQPVFNEANLLERVDVWLERGAEPASLLDPKNVKASPVGVANLDYDAKGQRLRIDYKNGVSTRYAYDENTFRLMRLYTQRGHGFPQDCAVELTDAQRVQRKCPKPSPVCKNVQKLSYTYDPAGNITHIRDDAQQTIFFDNQCVEPSNDYVYDALYRLVQASGREHLGQGGVPIAHSHNDAGRVGLLGANTTGGRFSPYDGNAMGTYFERYVYDAVGNFLQMQHRRSDLARVGWTRRYTYGETSLIEGGKQSNRLSSTQLGNGVASAPETYLHDAHGNMVRMPHLGGGLPAPNMHWDYKDQLRQVEKGGGGAAFYVYDASGQRVRKVWEKAPGLTEERIYLGGFEIFRRHGGPIGSNTVTLERETLHLEVDAENWTSC